MEPQQRSISTAISEDMLPVIAPSFTDTGNYSALQTALKSAYTWRINNTLRQGIVALDHSENATLELLGGPCRHPVGDLLVVPTRQSSSLRSNLVAGEIPWLRNLE